MKKLLFFVFVVVFSVSIAQTTCECIGTGDATLVLDAGLGGWSVMYRPLSNYLEKHYKVCLISRDGYAGFLKGSKRDSKTVASEILEALKSQGINDSIIFIGHSWGGINARVFQSEYPERVKALILLDATHPAQFNRLPEAYNEIKEKQPKRMLRVEKLASKGYLKPGMKSIPTFGLPEEYLDEYYAVTTQDFYYNTYYHEIMCFDNSMQQVAAINEKMHIPLLVLSARNNMDKESMPGKSKKYPFDLHNLVWLQLQEELCLISSDSEWKIIEGNHYFMLSNPEETARIIMNFIDREF